MGGYRRTSRLESPSVNKMIPLYRPIGAMKGFSYCCYEEDEDIAYYGVVEIKELDI